MPWLRRRVFAASFALCVVQISGQQAATPATQTPEPSPATAAATATIKTSTQLVLVDVAVVDRDGKPVKGLKAGDFAVSENGAAQTVRNFEEFSFEQAAKPGPKLPPMPAGEFTNYDPVPQGTTLNVLLLDAMNTPMSGQVWLRNQLKKYVDNMQPGTRVAIFGMNPQLIMLQGFTSDTALLKKIIDSKNATRTSPLLQDAAGSGAEQVDMAEVMGGASSSIMAANLANFEQQVPALAQAARTEMTLDDFAALAHYLANFPGRKNVIWFSAAFPVAFEPNPTSANPFVTTVSEGQELRDAINLLARSQVALYPVDARGLETVDVSSMTTNSIGAVKPGSSVVAAVQQNFGNEAAAHQTMEEMAAQTGGHAYYNTNDLGDAARRAMAAGANYYTVAYSPTNHNYDGNYRSIKVQLAGAAAAKGYTLTYRQGYYADDPNKPRKAATKATVSEATVERLNSADSYARIAMSRGSPQVQDVLIKVKVLPDATTPEDVLAKDSVVDPKNPLKGPYRRLDVDYAVLASDLDFEATADGSRMDDLEFKIHVCAPDGTLLVSTGHDLHLKLKPEQWAKLSRGSVAAHMQVSVPANGESFLRVAVRDGNTGKFGVVEVPVSSVVNLPVYPKVAAAKTDAAK